MDCSFNRINANKELISSIMAIKRSIAEIVRDRLYIKDFSSRLIEYLYELDDMSSRITVEILQKTDLHKGLKPVLGFSDAHFEVKDVCNKVLSSILENMKQELLEEYMIDDIVELIEEVQSCNVDQLKHQIEEELMKNITTKAQLVMEEDDENFDESIIRTDTKYLNYIKKIEMHMFLESKRRTKTKRTECDKKAESEIEEKTNEKDDKKSEENSGTNQNIKIINEKIQLNCDSISSHKKTNSPHLANKQYSYTKKKKVSGITLKKEEINQHLKKENTHHKISNGHSKEETKVEYMTKKLNELVKSDKKLLRSLASKNINKFYELSQNSEYVNKPIKSQRKRNRTTTRKYDDNKLKDQNATQIMSATTTHSNNAGKCTQEFVENDIILV